MTYSRTVGLTHPRPRRCEHRLARHHPQHPLRGHKRPRAYDTGNERSATAPLIGNLKTRTDASLTLRFTYDGLDRLTTAQVGNPITGSLGFAYDLSGNRTRKTQDTATTTYTTATTSNRLTTLTGAEARNFTYDPSGNVTGDGPSMVHTYDNSGRRVQTSIGGQVWTYAYNAQGERLKKSGPTTTHYAYDEQGHLLGEYDATGKLIQETVWLDDTPVATLRLPQGATSGPANVYYVHADHLNTPRRITRPADNKVMWQWESEPFGNTLPNQNPQGQGTFVYALRFPGQVFDPETGLSYNYFRDYDSATGRYRQSDPIGLDGGSWSTYSYVENGACQDSCRLGHAANC
ncbi:MAG: RHS repeat-associated core domain-containing protein [Georgfuchsia sp.]